MLAELPLMFEGVDVSAEDQYRNEAILKSIDKINSVFETKQPIETPYEYMQFSEFLFRTATRPYRMMWRYKTIPITPRGGYSLLPHVVEEAVQDNLEFSKTLRHSEG